MIKITSSSWNSVGIKPNECNKIIYDFINSSNTVAKSVEVIPTMTIDLDDPIVNSIDDSDLASGSYNVKVTYNYDGYSYDPLTDDGKLTSTNFQYTKN